MSSSVRTAVITAAGYGTRFLPATKAIPKEMLPVVDRPIIQHLVEEVALSGIERVIIVVREEGGPIEQHFQGGQSGMILSEKKRKLLEPLRELCRKVEIIFVKQPENLPYGNASPMLAAAPWLRPDEAFVYLFGDDLTLAEVPVTKQLINFYDAHRPAAILAVQEVPDEEVERYGTVRYRPNPQIPFEIDYGVEKAPKGEAPSNMAQFGRFVFTRAVLEEAARRETGKDGELWVIDVLNSLAQKGEAVAALPIQGRWLTTGDPLRYLEASVAFALGRPDLRSEVVARLGALLARLAPEPSWS